MQTIAIINRKGGVAKTSTAHALGAGLIKRGKKVLFVDLDSQTNLSHALAADMTAPDSMQLLTKETSAAEAIQHAPGGDIIAGSESLATADAKINTTGKEYRLKEAISGLKYDYIIIDTPAALGTLTINALTAANKIIIPVQAELYSLQGIGQLIDAIDPVKTYCNPSLTIDGILLTRFYGRAVISRDMQENLAEVAKKLHTRLYKTAIRECISIKEAQASQQDIFSYAPRSNAAKDYDDFIKEFLKGVKHGKS